MSQFRLQVVDRCLGFRQAALGTLPRGDLGGQSSFGHLQPVGRLGIGAAAGSVPVGWLAAARHQSVHQGNRHLAVMHESPLVAGGGESIGGPLRRIDPFLCRPQAQLLTIKTQGAPHARLGGLHRIACRWGFRG